MYSQNDDDTQDKINAIFIEKKKLSDSNGGISRCVILTTFFNQSLYLYHQSPT